MVRTLSLGKERKELSEQYVRAKEKFMGIKISGPDDDPDPGLTAFGG